MMIEAVMMMRFMPMPMFMPMAMMMQPLAGPRPPRVLAEDQRLDGDRHGVGRHADAAEIDVVEVHQDDAVDNQDVARNIKLFAQDGPKSLRHVAVQHDVDRPTFGDALGKSAADALGKAGETLVGRR